MKHKPRVDAPSFFLALVILILGALILVDILDIWDVFDLMKLWEILDD